MGPSAQSPSSTLAVDDFSPNPTNSFRVPMNGHGTISSHRAYDEGSEAGGNGNGLARSPIVEQLGRETCVYKLIKFCEEQKNWRKGKSLTTFWRPCVNKFFDPSATLLLDFLDTDEGDTKTIELPAEFIPRYFKSKFDAGAEKERLMMATPYEMLLQNGAIVVDCPRTAVLTSFPNSRVITEGHLRVTFNKEKKIICWEFSSQSHEELYTRESALRGLPPPACNRYGLPPTVMTLLHVATTVSCMDPEITDLARSYHASGHPLSQLTLNPRDDEKVPEGLLFGGNPPVSDLLMGFGSRADGFPQPSWTNGVMNTANNVSFHQPHGHSRGANQAQQREFHPRGPSQLLSQSRNPGRGEQINTPIHEENQTKDVKASIGDALLAPQNPQVAVTENSPVDNFERRTNGRSSPSRGNNRTTGKRKSSGGNSSTARKRRSSGNKS